MQVEQLSTASGVVIEGPLLITPQIFGDGRGFSMRVGTSAALMKQWAAPPPLCRTIIRALAVGFCAACTTSWSPNPRENWCAARWV